MTPKHLLTNYLDLRGPDERNIVAAVIREHGQTELLSQLKLAVTADQETSVVSALALMRDVLTIPADTTEAAFWESLRTAATDSGIFELLFPLILDNRKLVRTDTVYTLGKLYLTQALPQLRQAISVYEQKHPDELQQLIQEIIWLTGVKNFDEIEEIFALGSANTKQAIRYYFTETFSMESLEEPLRKKYLKLLD